MNNDEIKILECDYNNPDHRNAIIALMNMFIPEEETNCETLDSERQLLLVEGLEKHPKTIVLLAEDRGEYVGLLVGFENFSTFTAMPMINIHDVYVKAEHRGRGAGRRLMEAIVEEGKKRKCSRITLEVRKDNTTAQNLYRSFGFAPAEPDLYYWRIYL